MGAKRYSAGAIFLQVVPVFANVQRAIEDEAKNIDRALGDQMERSGEKAGERAGKAASQKLQEELRKGSGEFERDFHKNIDGINRALGGINVNKLGNDLRREVTAIKRELAGLKDVDITAEGDFRRVYASIAELEGRLRAVRDGAKIVFRADIDNALRGFAKVEAAKEAIEDPVEIEVRVDTGSAVRQIGRFENAFKKSVTKAADSLKGSLNKEVQRLRDELNYLKNLRIGIDISGNQARREMLEIMAELEALSSNDPNVEVRVDSGGAWAELAALEAAIAKIDADDIDVDVDVDTTRARAQLALFRRSGDDAANSFRSFNIVLLAAAGAGPALVPVLGAIAGGLLAIGPAAAVAGAGLSSVIIGFTGVGEAVQALGAQQDQLAMTTQTAARAEESAAERIADARESAAEAVEAALERQKDAQEAYRDSIDSVREAEEALREAREAAKNTGANLDEAIADNSLAQDQALLDVFNATVDYNAILADGSATNAEQEQARINLEQARDALDDLRKEAKELAKEKKKWDKEGVNGTEEVQNAQEALNDAIDAQREAYEDLRDAARDVDEARRDGAEMVREAIEAQSDAMADLNAQQNAVNVAFDKLGPAGQEFALFLFSLREGFHDFRNDIQTVLLPAVQEAMESFFASDTADVARAALINLAEAFGRFLKLLSKSLQGDEWTAFFQMLADIGPQISNAYGRAFISFLEAMASIMTTLAPFALDFAEGFAAMMDSFAGWADSKEGQDALTGFLDYVREVGPDVLEFLGAFVGAFANIAKALAPLGELVLDGLTAFFQMLADMDTGTLGAILTGLLILITASQVAYAIMNLVMAGAALLTSTIGVWVFALVGIGLAIAYLWKTNEDFRDFMQDAWERISAALKEAWEDSIKPALEELGEALMELWDKVLQPFFEWLGPILLWLAEKLIPLVAQAFEILVAWWVWQIEELLIPALVGLGEFFVWLWEDVLKPTWDAIAFAAEWLWKEVLKPTWEGMKDGWEEMVNRLEWVWEHILEPVFDAIDTALDGLETAFEETVSAIETVWNTLEKIAGTPIYFFLDTVLNKGLIAGFNEVASWVGADDDVINEVPIPKGLKHFATGGVLPGYTPGRDVHSFYSPTAGRLELSGGEAIMRPEWTAAMGPSYVDQMNALARKGGVNAIRNALGWGGYWMGGVLPLRGASVAQHMSGYSGYAADMNVGSGYDDYGMPVRSWKKGYISQMNYIGDQSYGRWVVVNHDSGSSLYAHLSRFGKYDIGNTVGAGSVIGYVGDVGNTGTPPTSHLHFEVRDALAGYSAKGMKASHGPIPDWLMDIVKNPLDTVRNWVVEPILDAKDAITGSPMYPILTGIPSMIVEKATDKLWDVIPGWVKTAAGYAGDAANWVVDTAKDIGGAVDSVVPGDGVPFTDRFALGGILPYNGTMKYDSGGYLPPGLTNVVNLTGKPEPVFTNEQWDNMGGGSGGDTYHYEPHFEGSDLTAGEVAGDMNFEFRRLKRAGKYAEVGS